MKKKQWNKVISYGVMVSAVILLGACGKQQEKSTNDLHVIESAEVPTIDSSKSYDSVSGSVISKIQAALFRTNSKNEVEPDLAVATPEISKDGKVYTVKLRPELVFSDGSPIQASNFVYPFQRLFNPKTASQAAGSYYDILNARAVNEGKIPVSELGVKALDKTTLEIKLESPNPTFNRKLTSTVLAPLSEKYIKEKGKNYVKTDKDVLSSGPYILKDWDVNRLKWSYKKNKKYWNQKRVKINKVEVNVVKDASTEINLFESGKIDYASLSGDYIQKFKDKPGFHSVPINSLNNLEMGISSNPVLQNEHFRRALFQSINRNELVTDILKNGSKALYNPTPINLQTDSISKKDFSELSDEKAPKYDTKKAKSEWEIAQKEIGKNAVELELLADENDQAKKVGEYLQSQIEKNLKGVTIKVSVLPAKVRFQKMMNYKFDLAIGGWSGDVDPIDFIQQFYSTYEHNHGKIKDQELDQLIDKARKDYANDPDKRFKALQDANKILTNKAYVIPLYQPSSTIVVNPKLKGFVYKTGFDFTFAEFKK